MRPYIQPYLKSTPRVSPTVPRSYINRIESFETVHKSYIQHSINIRMSHDHGTIHSSTQTVSYDRHTTNTVQVRIIHGVHGIIWVYTVSHGLVYGLTWPLHQHELYNENDNYLLPPSIARSTQSSCCIILESTQKRRFPCTEGMQEGPPRPADHSNLMPLPSQMSRGTHQSLSDLS
jgi:hypothetical protein